jgi:hypothetical protein
MEVQSMKQRYGNDTFLVARPHGAPKLIARAAIHATFESLLRSSGCTNAASNGTSPGPQGWFIDVGSDDDELVALASSVGCGVSVLDPKVKDARAVEMTRCMNEEADRPFGVLQVHATNVNDPVLFSEILDGTYNTKHRQVQQQRKREEKKHKKKKRKKKKKHRRIKRAKAKLSALGEAKPTMLNSKRPLQMDFPDETKEEPEENAKQFDSTWNEQEKRETPLAGKADLEAWRAVNISNMVTLNESVRGVALDNLYARPDMPNATGPATISVPEGAKFAVGNIAVLKVTPHSEGDAPLRALLGAQKLLESGRVKCLVTEMNFDQNSTEALLAFFAELEHKSDFRFAHIGSLDYSELEITDRGTYPVFLTDPKQLKELFDTYQRIRSFDERSGFRVYSGSLSLDRSGHYFDYTNLIFACRSGFPSGMPVLPKGQIRFRNGAWWLESKV